MKVVGVGCGPGMITGEAIRALSDASMVYGSRRSIELARPFIPPGCEVHEITDYRRLRSLPEGAVVLSTGDPMLAGLGYLEGEVIPGISSLQVAAARLHLPIAMISVVIAHGRDHRRAMEEVCRELDGGKAVFLLADPEFDIREMAEYLAGRPENVIITLCEDLGYPDERIEDGTPASPPSSRTGLYSLVIDPGIRQGGSKAAEVRSRETERE